MYRVNSVINYTILIFHLPGGFFYSFFPELTVLNVFRPSGIIIYTGNRVMFSIKKAAGWLPLL